MNSYPGNNHGWQYVELPKSSLANQFAPAPWRWVSITDIEELRSAVAVTARTVSLGTLAPASSVEGAGSHGVVKSDIDPDGVAAQKGLQIGDVILEAGGRAVNQPADISAVLVDRIVRMNQTTSRGQKGQPQGRPFEGQG